MDPSTITFLSLQARFSLVGGHSGGVTPGPIPNPEVKPANDPGSTLVRELRGGPESCQPFNLPN